MKKILGILAIVIVVTSIYFFSGVNSYLFPKMPTCYNVEYTILYEEELDGEFIVINELDEKVADLNDYRLASSISKYFIIESNKGVGYINKTCEVVIEPEYSDIIIDSFGESESLIVVNERKHYFADIDKNINWDVNYDDLSSLLMHEVARESTSRFRDEELNYFDNTFYSYIVTKGQSKGLSDMYGNIIVPIEYDFIQLKSLSEEVTYVELIKDGKKGIINDDLEIVLGISYDSIYLYSDFIVVEENGVWGVVDYSENILINIEYDDYELEYDTDKSCYVIKLYSGTSFIEEDIIVD